MCKYCDDDPSGQPQAVQIEESFQKTGGDVFSKKSCLIQVWENYGPGATGGLGSFLIFLTTAVVPDGSRWLLMVLRV